MTRRLPPSFERVLDQAGIEAALGELVRYTGYRYAAVFRFDGATLKAMHLVDRDDPSADRFPDIPVTESYCTYVREGKAPFVTSNAPGDPRTEGHVKREKLRAYVGAPIYDADGVMYGTICCFNVEPMADDTLIAEVFLEAAQLLTEKLKRG